VTTTHLARATAAALTAAVVAGCSPAPQTAAVTLPDTTVEQPADAPPSRIDRRSDPAPAAALPDVALVALTTDTVDPDPQVWAEAWEQLTVELPAAPRAITEVAEAHQPARPLVDDQPADRTGRIAVAIDEAVRVGLRGNKLVTAIAIAGAESNWRANFDNSESGPDGGKLNSDGSIDYGVWQINSVHNPPIPDIYRPAVNADHMWRISEHGTRWTPWVVYNTGAYLQFVDIAEASIALWQAERELVVR